MTLGLRDATVLTLLLLCIKWISRALTRVDISKRWDFVKQSMLINLITDYDTRVKFCQYFQERWLIDEWIDSWTDAGRKLLGLLTTITTNNYVERYSLSGSRLLLAG